MQHGQEERSSLENCSHSNWMKKEEEKKKKKKLSGGTVEIACKNVSRSNRTVVKLQATIPINLYTSKVCLT